MGCTLTFPTRGVVDPRQQSTEFRRLGHQVVDVLADHLADPRGPVMPGLTPAQACALFTGEFSDAGAVDVEGAIMDAVRLVIGAATMLHHPGFIGHQVATPLPAAAVCDFVDALLNNGMAIFEMGKAGTAIERAVLRWLADQLQLPSSSSGVLTSGGSLGNLTALLAARQAKGVDPWKRGVRAQPLVVFVAATAHYSVSRAIHIMGLGDEGCVAVDVDERLCMDVNALEAAIVSALKHKKKPIAVVASAGSTAAGAWDPLDDVADVCARHGLWFHVDGAHGGPLALLPEYQQQVKGMERADSVVVDFHKMLLMPALVTAVLFRCPKSGAAAFAQQAGYLFDDDDDDGWTDVGRRTVECTKKMLGLKVWACLRAYGVEFFRDHLRECCRKTQLLATLMRQHDQLELLTEPQSNILCFRFRGYDGGHNAAVRQAIVDDGAVYCVQVHLHVGGIARERSGLWLRTTILNPRTTDAHLQAFVDDLVSRARS